MAKNQAKNPPQKNETQNKGVLKKMAVSIAAGFMALQLYACNKTGASATGNSYLPSVPDTQIEQMADAMSNFDTTDTQTQYNPIEATVVTFSQDGITVDGAGATAAGDRLKITAGGTYVLQGTATAYITANIETDNLHFIFNGLHLAYPTTAPIFVKKVEKTVITLIDGTENSLTDGEEYALEDPTDNEPGGALYVQKNLTINGGGALTVTANHNDGIVSKNTFKILDAAVTVTSADDGIVGRDGIAVCGAHIRITSGGDGMKTTDNADETLANIVVESGGVTIDAGADGMQAENSIYIKGGSVQIRTADGSKNPLKDNAKSAKGIKAQKGILITGGAVAVDSYDDSIHSNGKIEIDGGDIVLSAGDDGIHADTSVLIGGGNITVEKSYEGIESQTIEIKGGTIHVTVSDDGMNAAGGDGSSGSGRSGMNGFTRSGAQIILITGGYIVVNASGDGIDSNGDVTMSGGTLLINGSTSSSDGAIDYDGTFTMSGGLLIAAGGSGMTQAPSAFGTQYSASVTFRAARAANTLVYIANTDGEVIAAFRPAKSFSSIVVSSPELVKGGSYSVYTGGTAAGGETDGLCDSASGGTLYAQFTVTSALTTVGTGGDLGGQGGGGSRF